jgi:hypothetical protein
VNPSSIFYFDVDEPRSFTKSLNGEDSQHWKKAMEFKFQFLRDDKTWIFTPLTPNHKPVSCKWIFKIKYNANGFVARHRVHLVAKRFTQVEGIDFNETFPILHEWNQFVLCLQF